MSAQSQQKIEDVMSVILLVGITLACLLVLIGGVSFLYQYGHLTLASAGLLKTNFDTNVFKILDSALSLTPLGLIELGILVLVITQLVRVALLVWYYRAIHDRAFTWICLFIFITLVYSLCVH